VAISSLREDNGGEHRFDSWGGWAPQVDFNGQQVTVPGGFKYETQRRESTRDGAVATLQYKPNGEFKTTADIFYGAGTEKTKQTGLEGAIAFGAGVYDPNGQLSNATIANGVATSGTINNYKGVVRNHMFSNKDRLLSLGLNSELKRGDWRFEGDVSRSHGVKNISNFETTARQHQLDGLQRQQLRRREVLHQRQLRRPQLRPADRRGRVGRWPSDAAGRLRGPAHHRRQADQPALHGPPRPGLGPRHRHPLRPQPESARQVAHR
jgi:hypothetical protein